MIDAYGAYGRPLRRCVALLLEGPQTLADLVGVTGVPHRVVQALVAAMGDDIEEQARGWRLAASRRAQYAAHLGLGGQGRPDGGADSLPAPWLPELRRLQEASPPALHSLDHVPATPETVARRALWLDGAYDLAGRRLLFLGDDDLTSLAMGLCRPDVEMTVVDVDERMLAFLDAEAARLGLHLRCRYGDLRWGLPPDVTGWADVAFTDPPYTPEGVALFALRALQGMADHTHGRVVLAYGYSDTHPRLGLKVQRAVQRLNVVFEAILPGFNRYDGALAIGGAGDLYVCRPTPATWRLLERDAPARDPRIYTRGRQAQEGNAGALDPQVADQVLARVGPVDILVGDGWPAAAAPAAHRVSLGEALAGLPGSRQAEPAVVANLADAPDSALLRLLLAVNAASLWSVVPVGHGDLASESGQNALQELIAPKYRVRFYRSTPATPLALVCATSVPAGALDPGGQVARGLLRRCHGRIANAWAEALSRVDGGKPPPTRNAARARVAASGLPCLESRVADLPRAQIAHLLQHARASAAAGA